MIRAKLCGMKTEEAARAAEAAGADYIGFIFWRGSRRFVEPARAARIGQSLCRAKKVGVFVDEEADRVNAIARQCALDYVQLHGHETADYARQIACPVIKAYRYGDGFSAQEANAYPAGLILVDAFRPGEVGGTGARFDWREAQAAVAAVEKPVLIAGGIGAENVAEAADVFHPFGVDVSGSLEVGGEKSEERIRSFMREVRRVNGVEE